MLIKGSLGGYKGLIGGSSCLVRVSFLLRLCFASVSFVFRSLFVRFSFVFRSSLVLVYLCFVRVILPRPCPLFCAERLTTSDITGLRLCKLFLRLMRQSIL